MPSRDWLSASSGYLHTPRARAKVQAWFRKQDFEKNAAAGKSILDREFRQLGIREVNLEQIAQALNKKDTPGLYAAVGAGDVGLDQITRLVRQQSPAGHEESIRLRRRVQASRYKSSPFYIYGVGNLLTHVARCCNPVPGEDISGYITTGRGVSIHRQDCGSLLRLKAKDPERVIEVRWGSAPSDVYAVPLSIRAYDRAGLLRDITSVIDRMGLSIESFFSAENRDGKTDTRVTVAVTDLEGLRTLIARLRQLPNVTDVTRVSE